MDMITVARMTKPLFAGLTALALGAALAPSVASASVAPVPRAVATCAEGGRCSVGDVGPGGGKIIYVNHESHISNVYSGDESYLTITTSEPHGLAIGDSISLTGIVPAQLNIAKGDVSEVLSDTEFRLRTQLDLSSYPYTSGGVIPAAPGGWDYLQAAPQGWSGVAADPQGAVPVYSNISGNLLDWRMGSGDANTRILKRQAQNAGQHDFFYLLDNSGADWYIPSAMELWAMYKLFAVDSSSAATQGISPDSYFSSTSTFFDNNFGHLWYSANFGINFTDNPAAGLGNQFGNSSFRLRPVRKLWLHTTQTNVALVKTLSLGKKIQISSVTKEGTPVSIRVLKGSACTVVAPAKQNRKTFFTLIGGKKPGTCSLKITAPGNYQYWALDQSKTIAVK